MWARPHLVLLRGYELCLAQNAYNSLRQGRCNIVFTVTLSNCYGVNTVFAYSALLLSLEQQGERVPNAILAEHTATSAS